MANSENFYDSVEISLKEKPKDPYAGVENIFKAYLKLRKKEKTDKRQVWVFRGQSNSKWHLRTALERAIIDFAEKEKPECEEQLDEFYNNLGGKSKDKFKIECALIRGFKRKAHRYSDYRPKDENLLEWLSIMRHYGAPTRLLDFQYSFFGALYLALEGAKGDCSVWAFNSTWIEDKYSRLVYGGEKTDETCPRKNLENAEQIKEEDFKEAFWKRGEICAAKTANPYILNERLICQSGLFLFPTNINVSFHDNMIGLVNDAFEEARRNVLKFDIKGNQKKRNEALRFLKDMNIDRAVLFPDLQGYAESLRVKLAYPYLF